VKFRNRSPEPTAKVAQAVSGTPDVLGLPFRVYDTGAMNYQVIFTSPASLLREVQDFVAAASRARLAIPRLSRIQTQTR
jgi:hypothetical protein